MHNLGLILILSLTWLSQALPTATNLLRSVHPRNFYNHSDPHPSLSDVIHQGVQRLEEETSQTPPWVWIIICSPRVDIKGNAYFPGNFELLSINAPLPAAPTTLPEEITLSNINGTSALDFHVAPTQTTYPNLQPWRFPSSLSSAWITIEEAFDLVAQQANFPPPYNQVTISRPLATFWADETASEVVYRFYATSQSSPGTRSAVVGVNSRRTAVVDRGTEPDFAQGNPPRV